MRSFDSSPLVDAAAAVARVLRRRPDQPSLMLSSVEWADSEIEFVVADGPDPGSWHGLNGAAAGMASFVSAWQWLRTEAEEFRELDEERVLVLVRYAGRGKASGVRLGEIEARSASVYRVRKGKVVRLALSWDRDAALKAVGLEG